MNASVYLFDSGGDIVKIYERTYSFSEYKGFYHNRDTPIEKISGEYRRMFSEITKDIAANKERTNNLLKLAGTLEEENSTKAYSKAYTKIYEAMK